MAQFTRPPSDILIQQNTDPVAGDDREECYVNSGKKLIICAPTGFEVKLINASNGHPERIIRYVPVIVRIQGSGRFISSDCGKDMF